VLRYDSCAASCLGMAAAFCPSVRCLDTLLHAGIWTLLDRPVGRRSSLQLGTAAALVLLVLRCCCAHSAAPGVDETPQYSMQQQAHALQLAGAVSGVTRRLMQLWSEAGLQTDIIWHTRLSTCLLGRLAYLSGNASRIASCKPAGNRCGRMCFN